MYSNAKKINKAIRDPKKEIGEFYGVHPMESNHTPLKAKILSMIDYANIGRSSVPIHSSGVGPMIEEFVGALSWIKVNKSIIEDGRPHLVLEGFCPTNLRIIDRKLGRCNGGYV